MRDISQTEVLWLKLKLYYGWNYIGQFGWNYIILLALYNGLISFCLQQSALFDIAVEGWTAEGYSVALATIMQDLIKK